MSAKPAAPVAAAIRARRMTRAFSPTPLDPDVLRLLLDTARRAPSAGHTQAVEFLVLDTPADCADYWDTTFSADSRGSFRWQQLFDAPALIIVATRPGAYVDRYAEADKARPGLGESLDGWSVPFWWVDAGTVVQNLLLLSAEAGLGACLFGLFAHETAVKAQFGVPDDYRLVATIAVGQPLNDEPGRSAGRPRPALDDIVHRGRWPVG